MRFMDEDREESTNEVVIILTVPEAGELRDRTKQLLYRRAPLDHEHIDDEDYKKEITVSIYDVHPVDGYHPRFRKLILEDK